ncbi:unnamed protein product [Bemisia tabaci]|uniref:RING-type domain-containing protein n=1 Tax=Bemisia tabaci TaxID=7038 RepID=A0A9P0F0U3_BEMTA|nr:unnamed protein product [Bemisia tabaci]
MAPTKRSKSNSRASSANTGPRNSERRNAARNNSNEAGSSHDSIITGRVTRSSVRSSQPSTSSGIHSLAPSRRAPIASSTACRIATNVFQTMNNVIRASSSISRLAAEQAVGSSPNQDASSSSDNESNPEVDLVPTIPEGGPFRQGDFKSVYDYLSTIQKRLLYINKRLDSLLEKCKSLYIPRDPRVSRTEICENANIDVANYNTSRLVCPVCYCDLLRAEAAPLSTKCGHIFCSACLIQIMVMDESKCPNCRKPLTTTDYHPVFFPQLLS